jgi:hypothetical protein
MVAIPPGAAKRSGEQPDNLARPHGGLGMVTPRRRSQ